MKASASDTQLFYTLFLGNQSRTGRTIEGEKDSSGKVQVRSELTHRRLDPSLINRHLNGEDSIGIMPINEGGLAGWGCIDIDSYEHDPEDLVAALYDFDMPLLPFYSKSKHLHLFLFLLEPGEPEDLRDLLTRYRANLAAPAKTEIFPKQTEKRASNTYSWVNMPYFGNTRCFLDKEMNERSLGDMLQYAVTKRLLLGEHLAVFKRLPYHDAPPCVASGAWLRNVAKGSRNNYLFCAGVYWRAKDDQCDIAEPLTELNASLRDPLEEAELRSTVIAGLNRQTYSYKCNEMVDRCDKRMCANSAHGYSSADQTGFDYGKIVQHMTDPPYYTWQVQGQQMVFYGENEILSQTKFREYCVRYLSKAPKTLVEKAWLKIVNRAMEHRESVDDDQLGGFSTGSMWLEHTTAFFRTQVNGSNLSQVALGRTFEDHVNQEFVFNSTSYLRFLRVQCDFRGFSSSEIEQRFRSRGAYLRDGYWHMPFKSIPQRESVDVDIDFHDTEKEGDVDL